MSTRALAFPTRGLVVGYDAAVGSDFILGVSGSESSPEVQLDDASSQTTSRLLHVGFYGNYNRNASRLAVMVGFGDWNNNTVGAVTDGVTFSKAKAAIRWLRHLFAHRVRPALRGRQVGRSSNRRWGCNYTRASLEGFTEDGAGSPQSGGARSPGGVEAHQTRRQSHDNVAVRVGAALMVEGRAAWAHELSPPGSVTVRFAGDTATRGFDLEAPEWARNSALVGASLVGSHGRRLQFFASVGSEINRTDHGMDR